MVNLKALITDSSGNPIEGIPLAIHVIPINALGGTTKPYNLTGITNAQGIYILSQAQAYANFVVTANPQSSPQYQSSWSTAQGSSSTTYFSGAYVNLTLQSVGQSQCGTTCSSTCPCLSGYTCENGICVQNAKANTILNFSILDIIVVIAVILVVFIVIMRFKKK